MLGCLFSFLPALKESLVCAEERVLEIEVEDDDRNESRALDWALCSQIGERSLPQTWINILGLSISLASENEWRSHFIRGPPRG
jgi:hypothetical protein